MLSADQRKARSHALRPERYEEAIRAHLGEHAKSKQARARARRRRHSEQ